MEIYSALKAAWHTQDIDALRAGKPIVPRHVYLVISDLCSHSCSFCSFRSPVGWMAEHFGGNPNRMIPKDKCFEIIDDCAELGVKAIQFTGGGEPTIHPDHKAIIAHALDRGLQVGLVTHGGNMPLDLLDRLTWVRVSIDAGCRETYEKVHRVKQWDRVIANLMAAAAIKGPMLGANFVTTRENYREVVDFCALMKSLGVPYVKIAANLTTDGLAYYDGLLDEIMGLMVEAKALEDATFSIADVFERRLADIRIGRPTQPFCGKQHFSTFIGGNQKIYRCCNTAYQPHGEVGDLKAQRFKDWWLNEAPAALGFFDARTCRHCQFMELNEATAYLVKAEPPHVEFV